MMAAIRFQDIPPFGEDPTPYLFIESDGFPDRETGNKGKHTVTFGGGLSMDEPRAALDVLDAVREFLVLRVEVVEGTPGG